MSATLLPPAPAETKPTTGLESKQVKFGVADGFMQTLRKRVNQYFKDEDLSRRDQPRLYVKCFVILTWTVLSYCTLVFWATTWPVALLAAASLGAAMAGVGFNIQHDGGHGAFSKHGWINKATAFTLDILGGSSFIWKRTHNIVHHSYTNVTGVDGDIDLGVLGRLSPHQPRFFYHRLQHIYLWFLYGFITFKWQFRDDVVALIKGRVGDTRVPSPSAKEWCVLIAGKLIFLTLAFGVPLALHPWYAVAGFFFAASFVQGFLMSVVFQLAHVVEHADFPVPEGDAQRIENEWAAHQVETTVDFAQTSRLVSWYTGGLNFQIEHHLFPQICHAHYPAIAKIVEETSAEFGVKYYSHPTMWSAVKSHYRWLRELGRPVAA